MIIPSQTTIRVEDFPKDEQKWIGRLLFPLNQFLLAATNAINGNIAFGENIPSQDQTFNFVYGSTASFPMVYAWNLPNAPVEVRLASITENSSPIAAVISWSYSNGLVSIGSIVKLTTSGASSLTVGSTYNIVLRGNP
jgi:hypothetical protein